MKSMRFALTLALLACATPITAFADGTLAINVAPFASEVKLKDKVRKQLEGGGMEWGYANNRLVVTSVNKQFVGPVIDHLTRFGTNATLNSVAAWSPWPRQQRADSAARRLLARYAFPFARILGAEPDAGGECRHRLAQRLRVDLRQRVIGRVVHVEVVGPVEPGLEDRHAELAQTLEVRATSRFVVAARQLERAERPKDLVDGRQLRRVHATR